MELGISSIAQKLKRPCMGLACSLASQIFVRRPASVVSCCIRSTGMRTLFALKDHLNIVKWRAGEKKKKKKKEMFWTWKDVCHPNNC